MPLQSMTNDRGPARISGEGYCPICSCSQPLRVITPSLRGSRFAVVRCRRCQTEFLDPLPQFDEIKKIYSADYYKAWGMAAGETTAVAEMKKATFARRVADLRRYARSGKILDVGTASGFFLEVARDAGFDTFGVELSEYSGGIAASKFGQDHIHIGTLESAPFRPGTFDAIAMSDLLEHVTDPLGVLRLAHRLLKPAGFVLVTTPNTGSLSHKLMGERWTHYKLEHLFYSNPASMEVMARQTGFRIAMCRSADKVMTIAYLRNQLCVYRHWALTPLIRVAHALCGPLGAVPIRLTMGEMVVILEKLPEPAIANARAEEVA